MGGAGGRRHRQGHPPHKHNRLRHCDQLRGLRMQQRDSGPEEDGVGTPPSARLPTARPSPRATTPPSRAARPLPPATASTVTGRRTAAKARLTIASSRRTTATGVHTGGTRDACAADGPGRGRGMGGGGHVFSHGIQPHSCCGQPQHRQRSQYREDQRGCLRRLCLSQLLWGGWRGVVAQCAQWPATLGPQAVSTTQPEVSRSPAAPWPGVTGPQRPARLAHPSALSHVGELKVQRVGHCHACPRHRCRRVD